jgi:hypothetical protein
MTSVHKDVESHTPHTRSRSPEFWTAFFTGVLAGFTAALAAATIYALVYARTQIHEMHDEAQVQHLLAFVQQWDNFGQPVLILNADVGKLLQDYQREDPVAYVGFMSLAKEFEQTEAEHHGEMQHVSTDDVMDFYRSELSVGAGAPIKIREHPRAKATK